MKLSDGKTHYLASSGHKIDLLVTGSKYLYKDVVLICFTAAVSNREKKSYPFFSGVSIAEELNLTCLSISDYALSISSSLSLAWYAGSDENINYQRDIAEFIDEIPLTKKVICFGGSGGGFAALALASIVNRPLDVFVWNPQVSITKYNSESVFRYISIAFPAIWNEEIKRISSSLDKKKYISKFLSSVNIIHDLKEVSYSRNKRIIYFQNQTDRHLHIHAIPFFESHGYDSKIEKGNRFLRFNKNWCLHIGLWGAGHVGPPKKLINEVISFLAYKKNELRILDRQVGLLLGPISLATHDIFSNVDVAMQLSVKKGIRYIKLCIQSSENNIDLKEFKFAFYVLINGDVVYRRWYKREPFFEVEIDNDILGKLSGHFFIRDAYSDYVSYKFENDV